jgi:hypothetical protein
VDVLAIAGCAAGATPGSSASGGGPGGSAPASSSPVSSQGGGGGEPGALIANACAGLTSQEVADALGVEMKDGVQAASGQGTTCTWEGVDPLDGASVILTVEPFDETSWEVFHEIDTDEIPTQPLAGIGDEAVLVGGTILGGLVAIRKGSTQATLQVLGVLMDDQSVVDAAKEPLARLVASRM